MNTADVILRKQGTLGGGSCPLIASWTEIKNWAQHPHTAGRTDQKAQAALREIKQRLANAKSPLDAGMYQANIKDRFHNNMDIYTGGQTLQRDGPWQFLRARDRAKMQNHEHWFQEHRLNKATTPEEDQKLSHYQEPPKPGPKPAPIPKAQGRFIHYNDPNMAEYWDQGFKQAQEHGGSEFQVLLKVFMGGGGFTLKGFQDGCGNLEKAFRLAVGTYLEEYLRSKVPKSYEAAKKQFVDAGVELAKGFGIMAGAVGTAVALGAVVGGAVGSVVPVLGTGSGASAGASIAFLLATQLANLAGVAADASMYTGQAARAGEGFTQAWNGDPDGAGKKWAEVIATIAALLVLAMIARKIFKGNKAKQLEQKLQAERNAALHAHHPGPFAPPVSVHPGSRIEKFAAPIKRNLAKAKESEKLADAAARLGNLEEETKWRLEAMEHFIQAERSFLWQRGMQGHGMVVEELAIFQDQHIRPLLQGKSGPEIRALFQKEAKLEISAAQAECLAKDAKHITPGEIAKAAREHDFVTGNPGNKDVAFVAEGMKWGHKMMSKVDLNELKEIMSEADPAARMQKLKTFAGREHWVYKPDGTRKINPETGQPIRDYGLEKSLKKWVDWNTPENIARSGQSRAGVDLHNQHHAHHNFGKEGINDIPAEAWHTGLDSFHSKVMKGRDYLDIIEEIFEPLKNLYGSDREKGSILLGQFTTRVYLNSKKGKFTKNQIVNCAQLSTISRGEFGF